MLPEENIMAKKTIEIKKTANKISSANPKSGKNGSALPFSKEEIVADYRIANQSRIASILGRREVLTGKAKFGIFGDGKEVAQVAMAKFFKEGDFRSGYYRDQTFQFAIGQATVEQFFAKLYADADYKNDPTIAGRQIVS